MCLMIKIKLNIMENKTHINGKSGGRYIKTYHMLQDRYLKFWKN